MSEKYQKGQHLLIETVRETVEGEFHSMDVKYKVITLKNCILHPSGKPLEGINRYYENEIKKIRVLDPSLNVADKDSEAGGNWVQKHKTEIPYRPNKPPRKVTAADVVMNMNPWSNQKGRTGRKPNLTDDEYAEANKRIRSNVLIERKGKFFMDAVDIIKKEHCVGVSFEGTTLGRNDPVTLMCISTSQRAFVFDIQTMGDTAFEDELKNILQSNEIEKVIHDCRMISDCLYHKHGVTLNNVFDTQVAEIMWVKEMQGRYPRNVKGLPQCLDTYLNLPEHLIYRPKIRDGYIGADLAIWRERPLPCELQMAIVKNSVFLLPLREKLLPIMLSTFFSGVNIYLSVVRDAEVEIARDHLAKHIYVPRELLALEDDDDAQEQTEEMACKILS